MRAPTTFHGSNLEPNPNATPGSRCDDDDDDDDDEDEDDDDDPRLVEKTQDPQDPQEIPQHIA
eukprot:2555481-Pyramimonas_sp.AAC.1